MVRVGRFELPMTPAFETGRYTSSLHPHGARGRLRTCTVRGLSPGLYPLGYTGELVRVGGLEPPELSGLNRATLPFAHTRLVLSAGYDPAFLPYQSSVLPNELGEQNDWCRLDESNARTLLTRQDLYH